ncbi:phosphate signaling complex protein PhoU [Atopococcus tabaci]|uniref:phosphate signaling complex protein PhoU n=1 Tax=Atopococcus tabaci TaxID=269774 RepID=UPI0003FD0E02|nr:phosphate signaling complex protein PhoU [Atopococcus tabaci]
MRRAFEEELDQLHVRFFQMGRRVNEAINKSVKGFVNHDKEAAKQVIEEDAVINQFEHDLEHECIELIALQQPVTTDLRRIVIVMKAIADLERMGDHAVSISKSTIRVKGTKRNEEIEQSISDMADIVMQMMRDVLDAFVVDDAEKAVAVAQQDIKVDRMRKEIYQRCIEDMKKDPDLVLGATDYMLTSTYVERIGDYITNICEWIVYLDTGEIQELNTHHHVDDELKN